MRLSDVLQESARDLAEGCPSAFSYLSRLGILATCLGTRVTFRGTQSYTEDTRGFTESDCHITRQEEYSVSGI